MSCNEIVAAVLPKVNPNAPKLSLVQKSINKLASEKDISCQEIHHGIQRLNYVNCSRDVLSVDCHPWHEMRQLFFLGDERQVGESKTVLRHYQRRPEELEFVSSFRYLRELDHKKQRPHHHAKPCILLYRPMYRSDPTNTETYIEFCRVKLQLHHPFRDATDILKIDGVVYRTYQAAFDACQLSHDHGDDFYTDIP